MFNFTNREPLLCVKLLNVEGLPCLPDEGVTVHHLLYGDHDQMVMRVMTNFPEMPSNWLNCVILGGLSGTTQVIGIPVCERGIFSITTLTHIGRNHLPALATVLGAG